MIGTRRSDIGLEPKSLLVEASRSNRWNGLDLDSQKRGRRFYRYRAQEMSRKKAWTITRSRSSDGKRHWSSLSQVRCIRERSKSLCLDPETEMSLRWWPLESQTRHQVKGFPLLAEDVADLPSVVFPILLKIFSIIVKAYPRAMLWKNADPSMQFALTLVNQIQSNPVYLDMLVRAFDPNQEEEVQEVSIEGLDRVLSDLRFVASSQLPSSRTNSKGKGRADHPSEWIVNWFPDYLMSIKDLDSHRLTSAPKGTPPSVDDLAFSDAMATTMGFFMQTLQPRRFSEGFRAAIFEYGITVSTLRGLRSARLTFAILDFFCFVRRISRHQCFARSVYPQSLRQCARHSC